MLVDTANPTLSTLTSSTHSEQTKCYNVNTPAYSWTGSDGGSGIANYYYLLDQSLDVSSAVLSTNGAQVSSSTTSYTSGAKTDGTWYFHLAAKDNAGNVSSVSSYTTCIDTTKPTISGVSSGSVTSNSAVISWSTNESADSRVEYSLDSGFASFSTVSDANFVTSHSLGVSGLSASTPYYYRVKSKDAAGNEQIATSTGYTFTTTATPDTTAPAISSATATNITTTTAIIAWQTDEASDSKVDYGVATSYGSSASNANMLTSHSVALSGLSAGTTYHYKVTSKDASTNSASSTDLQFTTLMPDTTAPVVSSSSISSGTPTYNSDAITFTTDESSVCKIDYGLTASYANATNYEATATTSHSLALASLSGSTTYHYAITCKDASNNVSSATADKTFDTAAPPDTTAPVISSVTAAQITTSGAVISWTADENSDSEVEYGTSTSYGNTTGVSTTLTKNHSLSLTGLTQNTLYHYRVKSKDAYNNLAASNDLTFTTAAGADTIVPTVQFSSISNGTPGYNTATITFITDEIAVCKMDYGLTISYGSSTAFETTYTQSHSITLTGLSPNTAYHYAMTCKDTSSNTSSPTADQTVTTSLPPESIPPVLSDISAASISNASAVINWTTDEGADSFVEYGTTTSYGSSTTLNTSLVTTHAIGLSGLSASTLYHYRVTSKDQYGNSATSTTADTFTTATTADTTAPVISSISSGTPGDLTATLTWTTDEKSTSLLEYGTTTSYGNSTTLDNLLVTSHTVNLSGLTPGTLYHYRVKSKDAADNEAVSVDNTFTTAAASDTTAPVISSVSANNISTTGARISWTTDEASDSLVEYGTSTSYGSTTTLDATMTTGHSVNLTGLTKNTLYHFRVKSKDKYSNAAMSGDSTFTSASDNDTIKPVISSISSAGISTSSATITWTTDEAGTSQVEYGTTTSYGSKTTLDANLSTSHSVTLSGLSPGMLYYYKVKSTDAAGNEQTASADTGGNALSFTTSAPTQQDEDKTPPSCSVSNTIQKTSDTQIKITWTGKDNKTVDIGKFVFDVQVKDGDKGTWIDWQPAIHGTEAVYPGSSSSFKVENGHTYYFRCRAQDEAGNKGCYADDDTCTPKNSDPENKQKAIILVSRKEDTANPYAMTVSTWGLISFPISPSDPSISSQLADDIPDLNKGGFASGSQLFYWAPNASGEDCAGCQKYKHADTLVVGQGYWLQPSSSVGSSVVTLDVNGTPVAQDKSYDLFKLYDGWNMIGSPYLYNVDWSDVKVGAEGEADKTMTEAVTAGWLKSGKLWGYENIGGTLTPVDKSVADAVLQPWKGYFVKATRTCTLIFQPIVSKHKENGKASSLAKGLTETSDDFIMKISAKASRFGDLYNYFGVAKDASDDDDVYDDEDPPRVSPSVSLSFYGKNIKYSAEIKNKEGSAIGKTWMMAVETDVKDSMVDLSWESIVGNMVTEKIALLDVTANTLVDMTQNISYQYPSGNGGRRLFKIFYGKELVEKEQEKHMGPVNLLEAYTAPNPYRGMSSSGGVDAKGKLLPSTSGITFRYKLNGQVMRVQIEVYTITGKLVDKFEGELDGDTIWPSGNLLANGVYIWRITAYDAQGNQAKKINKLVVIK